MPQPPQRSDRTSEFVNNQTSPSIGVLGGWGRRGQFSYPLSLTSAFISLREIGIDSFIGCIILLCFSKAWWVV